MEELSKEIEKLKSDLETTKGDLDSSKKQLKSLQNKKGEIELKISNLESRIEALKDDKDEVEISISHNTAELESLKTKIDSLNDSIKQKSEEYERKKVDSSNQMNEFYIKFIKYLASSYVDSGLTQCYGGSDLATDEEKLNYMIDYLDSFNNFKYLLNNERNRVLGAYAMLSGCSLDSDEIVKKVDELLDFLEHRDKHNSQIEKMKSPISHIKEPSKSKANTGFFNNRGKGGNAYFGKSNVDTAVKWTVDVANYKLKEIALRGNDSIYNTLSARSFLGLGKTKKFDAIVDGEVCKRSLNKLPIHAVSFKFDGNEDLVFGGVRQDGCLIYKNLNAKSNGNYSAVVVTMNNTQLFNSLYLAIVLGGGYKKYANEFFSSEYARELKEQSGGSFLFEREEGYYRSEDNYFPTICNYGGKAICTGSHHGWDKPEKLDDILSLIIDFVKYIALKESKTPSGQQRLETSILSGITLYGWFDRTKQAGGVLNLK